MPALVYVRTPKGSKSSTSKLSGDSIMAKILSIFLICLCLFIFATYYSHVQLHEESKVGGLKEFVTNIVAKDAMDVIRAIEKDVIPSAMLAKWEEEEPQSLPSAEAPRQQITVPIVPIQQGIVTIPAAAAAAIAAMPPPPPPPPPPTSSSSSSSSAATIETGATTTTSKRRSITPQVLTCPNADLVQFWRPPNDYDANYVSPYFDPNGRVKYVTFEPDVGGWNNIRMQMELVLVFAAATGRTLVLPPDQPMYLLDKGKGHQKHHSFADFFPFDYISNVVPVISMEEFMAREAVTGHMVSHVTGQVQLPPGNRTEFEGTVRDDRLLMWDYLRNVSTCPLWKGTRNFLVIPSRPGVNSSLLPDAASYKARELVFAGDPKAGMLREPVYYDSYWHDQPYLHFISKPGIGLRLLEHFYCWIHFEDAKMDRHYKRFIRDFVHYVDIIFCKAAIIIKRLRELSPSGEFSSFHVRRGEFQYKEVKIPAEEMMQNVAQFIPPKELLFIATDEHNKSFFDPFRARGFKLKFLEDFNELGELKNINPNFLGMIDQVVCTRGRHFFGTWFSTFTGYITRMRGYMGYPDNTTWYGDKKHRDRFQVYELPKFPFYMRENSIAWFGIEENEAKV